MSNNNDYTTGNVLDFGYFKENYKLIATDLSKQTRLKDQQQINFIGNSKTKIREQQCFSSLKNQKRITLIFTKFCLNHINNGNPKDCKFIKWH